MTAAALEPREPGPFRQVMWGHEDFVRWDEWEQPSFGGVEGRGGRAGTGGVMGEAMFEFPIRVTAHVCANGETWEYRVWMGETKVGGECFSYGSRWRLACRTRTRGAPKSHGGG